MSSLEQKRPLPEVGDVYECDDGRLLNVEHVQLRDPLGREVQGKVMHPGTREPRDYSCDLQIWQALWYKEPKPPDDLPLATPFLEGPGGG